MANEDIAGLLRQLGDAMIERSDQKQSSRHLFLCAEVVPGVISPALYQIYDDNIRYVTMGKRIGSIIYKLWWAVEKSKVWRGIRYEIIDRSFTVAFDYPDGPYPTDFGQGYEDDNGDDEDDTTIEDQDARMMAAVRARFGDKPIIYPTDEDVVRQAMLDNATYNVDFDLEPPSSG